MDLSSNWALISKITFNINNLIINPLKQTLMKKYFKFVCLVMMAVVSYGLTACGNDDDDDNGGLSVTPNSVSMHYDETKQLKADGATSWSSEDEFVATVDAKGLVTGEHVGKTKIIASSGKSRGICDVEITPEYTLYTDPILNWGASMSTIKSEVNKELLSSDEKTLTYKYTIGSDPCVMGYSFENSKLKTVVALFAYSYYLKAGYYLIERFQPVYSENDQYLFIDAMKPEKAKTAVLFSTTKSGSTTLVSIIYTDYNTLGNSKAPNRSMKISEDIQELQDKLMKYFE